VSLTYGHITDYIYVIKSEKAGSYEMELPGSVDWMLKYFHQFILTDMIKIDISTSLQC